MLTFHKMDKENRYFKLFNQLCIEQLWQNVSELSSEKCNGCEIDHPSQTEHSCLMDSKYIKLILYFELAFTKLDPEKIYSDLLEKYKCDQQELIIFWNNMNVYASTDIWKQFLFTNLENDVKDYSF